jgi:hypothetical protein
MLDEFENITSYTKSNFIENPINSFLLIKMLTKNLDEFIKTVNTTNNFKSINTIC